MQARFRLGTCVVTPGALEILNQAGIAVLELLERHAAGDWGELDEDDRIANEQRKTGTVRPGKAACSSG